MARWSALLLALGLVVAGAVQLASSLYYEIAKASSGESDVRRAVAASDMASQLRRVAARAFGGRLAAVEGDAQSFVQRYTNTLRDAPADPYRWAEFARALALVGDFGPHFDQAVARAQQLAPHSPAVHLALADIRWRHGAQLSDAQLAALYPSYVRTMQNLVQRQKLLDRIVRARRHPAFCAEYGAQFTGGRWCARIEAQLAACAEPAKLDAPRRRWCRDVEALP